VFLPKIDEEKCKQRGECFRTCPEDVFDMNDGSVTLERPGDCSGCEACVVLCPEAAVQVEEI